MHAWLASIGAHPGLVLVIVFGVACAESLAVVGTFVPAGIVMFAAGALIGAGVLDGWVTLGVAALGAVAGDGISYELGHRYAREVRTWWVEKGHEAGWARGEQFVARHGGKSIAMARFFAPVRAIVPLVVGAARMPRHKFYPINIASALAWSPAHIGPGIVFGASAQLAEAVSGRLAAMLLLLAALLWLIVRLTRVAIRSGMPLARVGAQRAMARLERRHPRLARRLSGVVGPDRPESPTLLVLALLLIGSVWLFLGILQDVVAHDPFTRADTVTYSFLQGLRTAPGDDLMVGIVELSTWSAGLVMAAAVLIWLMVRRCWRTAVYWALSVAIAGAVSPVLEPSDYVRPFDWQAAMTHAPLPSGNATFNILIYGFLGWLLVHRRAPLWRSVVITLIAVWVALTGLARLYLGENWLADVLGGWSLGLAWFAVVAGLYTYWRVQDDVRPGLLAGLVMVVLAIFGPWTSPGHLQAELARYRPAIHETGVTLKQWSDGGWRELPARRTELSGDQEEALPLQWVDDSTAIAHRLEAAGWRVAPAWSAQSTLMWLSPRTSVAALPVLPKLSEGHSTDLTFAKFDPDRPMDRVVLRLWRSRFRLTDGGGTSGPRDVPVWYGALYQEAFRQPWHLVILGKTAWPDAAAIPPLLPAGMQTLSLSVLDDGEVRHAVLVLPTVPETPSGTRMGK
ncbi:LssY C-terminal domain-containing protein [Burkholderia cenocepacia]|uniref:bifunctional DedA family/phosphatase PAP2 family protein n=2 Tax=Burkholderia cenocepacia TaxID=95486 RepID=UPI00196A91AF|nr:bifunctional DedA family/phosphatase PAP2 family protein [Burkholderia cenocepacia]MBN3532480.1 LssY C-terminal domain-containing protein [Burkholderia cenocepacia]MBO1859057.1 LssY C-terminal domain-containing protein [Burkholderia cenocepacia]MBR8027658.1 LssY C-terminal domain-containing protein [Burkholderia cenocepacia]MBR8170654.1 LssY C-terminal domain-containing protein [Burkholderia cenocepacia]MBR8428016.1 LssY C-terminal domain-containing protein [Burkholderia cenocepacia]